MTGMRVLVTGGAGFIGSNFIRHWVDANPRDEVTNVDLLTYAGDSSSLADVGSSHPDRYHFIRMDICDLDGMVSVIQRARPNVIVNFAAESHNSRAVVDPSVFLRTNVLGTQAVLEAARRTGVDRVHHISTCEVYGDLPLDAVGAFTEESAYRPRTPYNASKAAADHIVRAYHHTFGTPVTISNSCNNYGPWQYPEKMIPLFITSALADRPLPLYRSSANRREWIHVADHCRAIAAILSDGRIGETYNVGTGDERSIEEVADLVLRILDKPASLKRYVDDRPGHDRRYLLDHTKISVTGWRPRISFEAGLAATIQWYAEHGEWWQRKTSSLDEFGWASGVREPQAASAP
jgi:dTDP-glucose 4,6-dehydratase